MNRYVLKCWVEDFNGNRHTQLSLVGTSTKLESYLRMVKRAATNLEERRKILGEEEFKNIYSIRRIEYLYTPVKYVA